MKEQFIKTYINNLQNILDIIDIDSIQRFINILENLAKNNKIYIIGNGGSAATASHMVNDLGVGLKRRDILDIDIVSLADNTAVTTAIANDIGYDNIFYVQLTNKIKKDDILIAISCSGNSANILKAVQYSKNIGTTIVGLTGFDGGELKVLSDIKFHIPTKKGEYGLVEDLHMIFDHIVYSYFIQKDK